MKTQAMVVVGIVVMLSNACDPTCEGKATVVVTDPSGARVSGATVTWLCCAPEAPGGCVHTTDSDGQAVLGVVEPGGAGTCEIRVEKAGFASITQRYEWACQKGHTGTVNVPVTLRPQ